MLLWEIRLRLTAPIRKGKLLHIAENARSGILPARLFCHFAYQQFLSSSWSCLFLTSPGFFSFYLVGSLPSRQCIELYRSLLPEAASSAYSWTKPRKLQTLSSKAQIPRSHFPLQTYGCQCSHRFFYEIYLLLILQVLHPRVLQGSIVSTVLLTALCKNCLYLEAFLL